MQPHNIKNIAIRATINGIDTIYIVEDLARTGPPRVACIIPVGLDWEGSDIRTGNNRASP